MSVVSAKSSRSSDTTSTASSVYSWVASLPGASLVGSFAVSIFGNGAVSSSESKGPEIDMRLGRPMICLPEAADSHQKVAVIAETIWRADYGEKSTYDAIMSRHTEEIILPENRLTDASVLSRLPMKEWKVNNLASLRKAMIDEESEIPRSCVARLLNPSDGSVARHVILDNIISEDEIEGRDVDCGTLRNFKLKEILHPTSPEAPVTVFQALPRNPNWIQCWREELTNTWTQAPKNQEDLLKKTADFLLEKITPGTPREEAIQMQQLCKELSIDVRFVEASEEATFLSLLKKELKNGDSSCVFLPLNPFWVMMKEVDSDDISYSLTSQKSGEDFLRRSHKEMLLRKDEDGLVYLGIVITCPSFDES